MKTYILVVIGLLFTSTTNASLITNDIIFGSGNSNGGFTISQNGDLELALRAKQRYTNPNDQIGVGIVQDSNGNYIFNSAGQTVPADRALWSFDWSINSDIGDGVDKLNTYAYLMRLDFDPTSATNFIEYDPLGGIVNGVPTSTGFYLGDNTTANGAGLFSIQRSDLPAFNIAQNSVNSGFFPGISALALGAGQFTIELLAFNIAGQTVASTSINVLVDTAAVPSPATLGLMLLALGGIFVAKRRKQD